MWQINIIKEFASKIKFTRANYFHSLLRQIRFSKVSQTILDNFLNKEDTFYFSSWRKQIKIIVQLWP